MLSANFPELSGEVLKASAEVLEVQAEDLEAKHGSGCFFSTIFVITSNKIALAMTYGVTNAKTKPPRSETRGRFCRRLRFSKPRHSKPVAYIANQ